jgi:hypothetical protein
MFIKYEWIYAISQHHSLISDFVLDLVEAILVNAAGPVAFSANSPLFLINPRYFADTTEGFTIELIFLVELGVVLLGAVHCLLQVHIADHLRFRLRVMVFSCLNELVELLFQLVGSVH